MASEREIALGALQPSQLYVSEEKLTAVTSGGAKPDEPLPVKELCGRLVLTDGHTRALAAHLDGKATVSVIEDEDELDWEAYEICVAWCVDESVESVADLASRVVSRRQYETLWLERCHAMQRDLAARRLIRKARRPTGMTEGKP